MKPVVALASVLASNPGSYALLLGSGASNAAGILTGWEIAVDLIRRAASAEDSYPDDPVDWYESNYGPLDYSDVVEKLAPSPGDRQALLDPYFEPTDEEREEGKKQPTAVHRAIVELVRSGAVRVIITTNFDRLVERALADAGIEPVVISSEADAFNAAPLHTMKAVVIKLHGDRRSPSIRNTVTELSEYEPALQALASQVFREYGLVVVGWSGAWDPALRRLLTENQSAVFSTFWAYRGDPPTGGQEVIKTRSAVAVPIEDADTFLSEVQQMVTAINASRPDATTVSTARLKMLMSDERQRIQLHDMVMDSVERLIQAVSTDRFSTDGATSDSLFDVFIERLRTIEEASQEVMGLLSTLAYYADSSAHDELLVKALARLTSPVTKAGGYDILIPLQRYHATLALYAAGIASIASGRLSAIARCLGELSGRDETMDRSIPVGYWLAPSVVVHEDALKAAVPDLVRQKTAVSDYVYEVMKSSLSPLIRSVDDLEGFFDDFEYLMGIASLGATDGRWGPGGRFVWRRGRYAGRGEIDGVVDRFESDLLNAGLADGREALEELRAEYNSQLARYDRL